MVTAVMLAVGPGTATGPTATRATPTIPSGRTSAEATLTLIPVYDTVDETVSVTGTATGFMVKPATAAIAHDDVSR